MVNSVRNKMEKVAISVFKARCLSMLEKVRRTGTPILITRRGEPIAEVTPPSPEHSREDWLGSAAGTGEILGDIVSPIAGGRLGGARQMKLLLDTHVWLWSLLEPARLRPEVARALASSDNQKWLSPISVWETLLLGERGRLRLEPDPEAWVRAQLQRLPVRQVQVDHEIAIQSRRLRTSHQDPADRFIAATARVHELTLVTADARLWRRPDGYAVLRA